MKPRFFKTPAAFRDWLDTHHDTVAELWVGFYKKGTGKPSITWPESVDAALCYGWIDGVRRSLGAESYVIRFTPRRDRSIWSATNIESAERLIRSGDMRPAGMAAFERRREDRSRVYSFEQDEVALSPELVKRLEADEKAWGYWQKQPPSYRRTVTWWIVSAKREETRLRRLDMLIADSAEGRWVKPMRVGRQGKGGTEERE